MIELAYFAAGWAAAVSAVALGGYLVFRTKRETYEPLFGPGKPVEETAINLVDPVDMPGDAVTAPQEVQARNDDFVHAFAERLAKASGVRSGIPEER